MQNKMGCMNFVRLFRVAKPKEEKQPNENRKKTWKTRILFLFSRTKRVAPQQQKQQQSHTRAEEIREKACKEQIENRKEQNRLRKEIFKAKCTRGGLSYDLHSTGQTGSLRHPVLPPRLKERLKRPSSSMAFDTDERKIMADIIRQESLREKGRRAKLSEERKLLAQSKRENKMKWKNYQSEMKMKTREEKLKHTREVREKMMREESLNLYEKQQKAKYRRDNSVKEKIEKVKRKEMVFEKNKSEMTFEERRKYLMNKYANNKVAGDTGLPGVDV